MTTDTATTSNYYQIAKEDDTAVETGFNTPSASTSTSTSSPNYIDLGAIGDSLETDGEDRDTIRSRRMEAAVQRSKFEYKAEHAYTERGWFLNEKVGESSKSSKLKIDRQRLEYTTGSLYLSDPRSPSQSTRDTPILQSTGSGPADEALKMIMEICNPSKPLGDLSKELLDIGMRSAILTQDREAAIKLARLGKSAWKSNLAGMAAVASDAFMFAGLPFDAVTPLLWSISNSGLHYPILVRFVKVLDKTLSLSPADTDNDAHPHTNLQTLRDIIQAITTFRQKPFQRSLFIDEDLPSLTTAMLKDIKDTEHLTIDLERWNSVDEDSLKTALLVAEEDWKALRGALGRVGKAIIASQGGGEVEDEKEEKGVREL